MRQELLDRLRRITPEEQELLDGSTQVRQELYTTQTDFTVDSGMLLKKGQLIQIRPHTRFVHFPRHTHNYVEMVYMCQGTTTHIINGSERILLEPGDILFMNEFASQEILPAGEGDLAVNFIILPEFFDHTLPLLERENLIRDFLVNSLSRSTSTSGYLHFHTKGLLPVENLMENMIWTLFSETPAVNTLMQTTMGLLFMNLSRFAEEMGTAGPASREQSQVYAVLRYIESHYRDGSLAEIAEILEEPTYQISRMLKKHTGYNFKDLLLRRKLQQAQWLLTETTLSADDIIYAIGYDNSSYFYRKFRERYGCSPKEYRRRQQLAGSGGEE